MVQPVENSLQCMSISYNHAAIYAQILHAQGKDDEITWTFSTGWVDSRTSHLSKKRQQRIMFDRRTSRTFLPSPFVYFKLQ